MRERRILKALWLYAPLGSAYDSANGSDSLQTVQMILKDDALQMMLNMVDAITVRSHSKNGDWHAAVLKMANGDRIILVQFY